MPHGPRRVDRGGVPRAFPQPAPRAAARERRYHALL